MKKMNAYAAAARARGVTDDQQAADLVARVEEAWRAIHEALHIGPIHNNDTVGVVAENLHRHHPTV